jgi:hypothetical protein
MSLWILTHGKTMLAPLAGHWSALQARLDGLVLPVESPVEGGEPEIEKKGGLPPWALILIIGVVILCVIPLCLFLLFPVILTLMGPSVGNVFSNILEELVTPTP